MVYFNLSPLKSILNENVLNTLIKRQIFILYKNASLRYMLPIGNILQI